MQIYSHNGPDAQLGEHLYLVHPQEEQCADGAEGQSESEAFLNWLYDLRDEVEKGDTEIALLSIDGMIGLQGRQSSVGAELTDGHCSS